MCNLSSTLRPCQVCLESQRPGSHVPEAQADAPSEASVEREGPTEVPRASHLAVPHPLGHSPGSGTDRGSVGRCQAWLPSSQPQCPWLRLTRAGDDPSAPAVQPPRPPRGPVPARPSASPLCAAVARTGVRAHRVCVPAGVGGAPGPLQGHFPFPRSSDMESRRGFVSGAVGEKEGSGSASDLSRPLSSWKLGGRGPLGEEARRGASWERATPRSGPTGDDATLPAGPEPERRRRKLAGRRAFEPRPRATQNSVLSTGISGFCAAPGKAPQP